MNDMLDFSMILYLCAAVAALVIVIYIVIKIHNLHLILSVTSLFRGNRTERNLILRLRKLGFDSDEVFHDLYISKPNGKYAQVDAVAMTDFGIIVFEVKNYSGWIFGNGYNSMWTQTFPDGKSKKFYNPILQNKNHIEALKNGLKKFGDIPFISVVVFYGSSELKEITFIPDDTFVAKDTKIKKVLNRIRDEYDYFKFTDREGVYNFLCECTYRDGAPSIEEEHIDNIKESMGRDRIFD